MNIIPRFARKIPPPALPIGRPGPAQSGRTPEFGYKLLVSNDSLYFSYYNPKISASNLPLWKLQWAQENVPISSITNFDFLMYFHNSLIPSVTYIFLPQEKK